MLFFAQIIANTETSDIAAVFLKMIIACAVVILLAFLSIKYLLPRIGAVRRNKKSQIQIIDYQPLEPRKGIYIVVVEGKKMAIGVSENSVTKLCELD